MPRIALLVIAFVVIGSAASAHPGHAHAGATADLAHVLAASVPVALALAGAALARALHRSRS